MHCGEHGTAMAPWFVTRKAALLPPKTQMRRPVYASNLNQIFYADLDISMLELPAYLLGYAYGCVCIATKYGRGG